MLADLGNLVAINVFQSVSSARSARGARNASLIAAAGSVVLCVPLDAVAVADAGLLGNCASDSSVRLQLPPDRCRRESRCRSSLDYWRPLSPP